MPKTPPSEFRVALVSMPFALTDRPAIQLGLLAAILQRAGFACDTQHLHLDLAAELGEIHTELCLFRGRMTGEWLFSRAAFGDEVSADDDAYFKRFPEEVNWAEDQDAEIEFLSRLRHEVLPRYIDRCVDAVDWSRYAVVGFSSTFQQNVSSLALARRLKRAFPRLKIVFGGANVEGVMGHELVRAFDFVDFVLDGEADNSLPELIRRLAADEPLNGIPGLVTRDADGRVVAQPAQPTEDLDALPVPDFEEFFERRARLELNPDELLALPIEGARGCWWGRKHHCTFCGQNGQAMGFRSKSPPRFIEEVAELARRHRGLVFHSTDNILDHRYVDEVFGTLAKDKADYQFFYEVKSNVNREQLRTLWNGGVRWIQPGIESMSSRVLALMKKGCTMIDNVKHLKWAHYFGFRVAWNLLWGFPGERAEDFEEEYQVLRLLGHLEPPAGCDRVFIERFAPLFMDRARFPAKRIQWEPSYGFAYPDYVDLGRLAYFYEAEFNGHLEDEVHGKTVELVKAWKQTWTSKERETLTFSRTHDAVYIQEGRRNFFKGTHELQGPLGRLYVECSGLPMTVEKATRALHAAFPDTKWAEEDVESALTMLCERGWMVTERGKYFGLAIPENRNW